MEFPQTCKFTGLHLKLDLMTMGLANAGALLRCVLVARADSESALTLLSSR